MAKSKQIRRALVSSLTTLVLCVAMLVGSTYAWFSNNATVAASKIQVGDFAVGLQQQTKTNDGTTTWTTINSWDGITFGDNDTLNRDNPTKSLTLRVVCKGSLAASYDLKFTGVNDPDDLAEKLNVTLDTSGSGSDVESPLPKSQKTAELAVTSTDTTLASVLKGTNAFASGNLKGCSCAQDGCQCNSEGDATDTSSTNTSCTCAGECVSKTITLTFELKSTDAGNKTTNLDDAQKAELSGLKITLLARQDNPSAATDPAAITATEAAMPNVYVQIANSDPTAAVYSLDGEEAEQPTVEAFDFDGVCSFRSLDDLDGENPYADYHADVVITADGDMEAQSLLIAAYSELFCDGDWLGWMNDAAVEAGEEIRLMQALWGDDVVVSYAELFENDAKLKCALSDLGEGDSANTGTTVKVELRLYEIDDEAETGEYLTIGDYEYTF